MKDKISKKSKKIYIFAEKQKTFFLALFFIGLSMDLFYFKLYSDIRIFALLALWIFIIKISDFKSDSTFKLSLGMLGMMFVFFGRNLFVQERIAVWIFLLLTTGLIQQFFEFRKSPRS